MHHNIHHQISIFFLCRRAFRHGCLHDAKCSPPFRRVSNNLRILNRYIDIPGRQARGNAAYVLLNWGVNDRDDDQSNFDSVHRNCVHSPHRRRNSKWYIIGLHAQYFRVGWRKRWKCHFYRTERKSVTWCCIWPIWHTCVSLGLRLMLPSFVSLSLCVCLSLFLSVIITKDLKARLSGENNDNFIWLMWNV